MDPIGNILGDYFSTIQSKDTTLNRLLDTMIKVIFNRFKPT